MEAYLQEYSIIMAKQRIIALVDMDCFYVQVEQRLKPELYDKPVAVVQYSSAKFRGGGLVLMELEFEIFAVFFKQFDRIN